MVTCKEPYWEFVKLAVSLTGPFIVTEAELLLPEYEPLPLPAQLLKL
jgi:hypothetical protein